LICVRLLRQWRSVALHIWRDRPGPLLALYLILTVLAAPGRTAPVHGVLTDPAAGIVPLALVAFLTWRVSVGGWFSRGYLILIAAKGYLDTALSLARAWQPIQLWLLAAFAAQIALLISPAVHQRTRPADNRGQRPGPMALTGTPRWWTIPAGLLAGLALSLALLGSQSWAAIPECGPAGVPLADLPSRCITLARGAPLHFLYGYQGLPQIDIIALLRDWTQWSVVCVSAICLIRLMLYGRKPIPDPTRPSSDGSPTSPVPARQDAPAAPAT